MGTDLFCRGWDTESKGMLHQVGSNALGLKGKGGVYSVDKMRNGIFDRGTNVGIGAEGLQVVCNCWILRWDRAGTVGVEAGDLIRRPCQGVAFGEGAERF